MTKEDTERLYRNIDKEIVERMIKKAQLETNDFNDDGITFGIFIPFGEMGNEMRIKTIELLKSNVNHYFEITAFKEDIKKLIEKEASVKILYELLRGE